MANIQQKLAEIETLAEVERNLIENIALESEEKVDGVNENLNNFVYSDADNSSDDSVTRLAANDQVQISRTAESASSNRTNEELMTAIAQHVHENTPQVRNRAQNSSK